MIRIVGAGPAGAALARFLSDAGLRVEVYEAAPRPAAKPCGWGVPVEIEEYLRIPQDAVVNDIMGYRIYLDGEVVHERVSSRRRWGYIVDKPRLIELLLEGVEARFSRRVAFRGPEPLGLDDGGAVVVAAGQYWPWAPRDRILALQYLLRGVDIDPDVLEIWFSSDMVGYAWVFPEGRGVARVGIGGYLPYRELAARLARFVSSRPGLRGAERLRLEGGFLVVSGIREEMLGWSRPYVVGEALGAVYPLTGEGIRPAVATAWALSRELLGRSSYREALSSTGMLGNMRLQRRLLGYIKAASPEARARVLRGMPSDVMERLSLGKAGLRDVLRVAVSRPDIIASLAKALLGGRAASAGREG